jgi:CheY-like chemotaxis protein
MALGVLAHSGIQMKDKTRRVLLVDPDSAFARKVETLLSPKGYDVEAIKGLTRAAERLRDVAFDCIIMATDLPEMKGHDAVPIVKAICPGVPVIMTAAQNTPELESRVRHQDIFYYYVKSFDLHELQMAVRDAFRKIGKENAAGRPDRPMRILIVDDDRDFVAAIESLLANNSYEVIVAYSKEDAMAMVESAGLDLVLLDIMMESMGDGIAICKRLKYDRDLRHIPVLVVSSIAEKAGIRVPIHAGVGSFTADDYIEKPVRSEDLLRRIERLLS